MAAQGLHLQVISIPVKNVGRSVAWYRDMFSLPFCFPFNEGDDEACLNLKGMGLCLIRSLEVPRLDFPNMKGEPVPILSFQVDNIHELHAEMIERGGDVREMVYKKGGGFSFRFLDPDGNCLGVWGGWPKEGDEENS
jgi:predicted enzyme related to lactoylglutathione lyase